MEKLKKVFILFAFVFLMSFVLITLSACSGPKDTEKTVPTSDFTIGDKNLVYEGEKKNDVIHGKGILYLGDEKIYEGDFVEGLIEGQGKLYADGKLRYEGQFNNNQASGKGIIYNKAGSKLFEGFISENDGENYKGSGTLYNAQEEPAYEGQVTIKDGKVEFSSIGKILYPTGKVFYTGELKEGMPIGKGTFFDPEGDILQYNK